MSPIVSYTRQEQKRYESCWQHSQRFLSWLQMFHLISCYLSSPSPRWRCWCITFFLHAVSSLSCICTVAGVMDQAWTGRPGTESAPDEMNVEPRWNTSVYLNCTYAAQSTVLISFKLDSFSFFFLQLPLRILKYLARLAVQLALNPGKLTLCCAIIKSLLKEEPHWNLTLSSS